MLELKHPHIWKLLDWARWNEVPYECIDLVKRRLNELIAAEQGPTAEVYLLQARDSMALACRTLRRAIREPVEEEEEYMGSDGSEWWDIDLYRR